MALENFYDIVVFIVGTPANDIEHFVLYMLSVGLGAYLLLLIFDVIGIVNAFVTNRRKF